MASVRLDLRVHDELLRRVDAARGHEARASFVKRALEAALGGTTAERPAPDLSRPAPALPRAPSFSRPLPFEMEGVRPASELLGLKEPNVDDFARTDDYRRAMALWRDGKPYAVLMRRPPAA